MVGRACGVVAALFLLLWLNGQWFGNLAAATRDGRWAVWVTGGRVDVYYSQTPALFVVVWQIPPGPDLAGIENDAAFFTGWSSSRVFTSLVHAQWRSRPAGWAWLPGWRGSGLGEMGLSIPLWCLAAPFAWFAVSTEVRHGRRLKREQIGKCLKCGYDRAGLAEGAACPECGKAA